MAQPARDYHNNLQMDGLSLPADSPEYTQKTWKTLNEIPVDQQLPPTMEENDDWVTMREQVENALHLAKNGSATGVDGCPYELTELILV
jgi:hypothetical protein